ncbi:N-lysine methyltransferase SETD6 isoform X3 [Pantherophis guttatus]|uniref:N-lysine methyltransferase SETD6 isoform X3 n=1 Tax=Pantherophis guttatus TaxID=94885 RepID=A0ABM3YMY1_PANGU|nr:N-lysine methyltransferase SETD6 isoform X3 [Pantherophis guttatus]
MAGAAKRPRRGSPASPARALPAFLRWCAEAGVELSAKVGVSREGTVAAYGLLARESLVAGEELFSIPRTALLSQHTSALAPLLRKEEASLQSSSGWVPLLISLLYECTVSSSRWGPYFSLWPQFTDLDHPMFWGPEEQARLLQGTGVLEAVEKDLANIEMEYSSIILPFLKAHPDLFNPKVHTLELYRRLVAFVMAYSFQEPLNEEEEEEEPNPPVMVPLADLLNHVANHNANLEYSPESLKMVTTQPVRKGQEIFNTYGEMANSQLLHMYGFAEAYPGNTNDTADIQMSTLLKAALQATDTDMEEKLVMDQWNFLCHQEMVGEEGAFVIGWERVFTEEELSVALQHEAIHILELWGRLTISLYPYTPTTSLHPFQVFSNPFNFHWELMLNLVGDVAQMPTEASWIRIHGGAVIRMQYCRPTLPTASSSHQLKKSPSRFCSKWGKRHWRHGDCLERWFNGGQDHMA